MKKILILSAIVLASLNLNAQTAKQEIAANRLIAASNLTAYYEVPGAGKLTPAPKGYKPFYISHYARHGSRYLCDNNEYKNPLNTLRDADNAGVLSEQGKAILKDLNTIYDNAQGRIGELTPKGAVQHRGIAKRMFEHYPEVFSGEAKVNGRSSMAIRCILSMTNECAQLGEMNPKIKFDLDASQHDMYYTAFTDQSLNHYAETGEAAESVNKFSAKHNHPDRLVDALFTDASYVKWKVDKEALFEQIFNVACILQSHDTDIDLMKYFTTDELYDQWTKNNYWWYVNYGPSPLSKGKMPFREYNLLNNIVTTADSIIKTKEHGATMRFGHEVCVLPLACLLELGECGYLTTNPDSVDQHWRNYKIYPMASNIQLIFYRSNKPGSDVLVKALLNEVEMTLPTKPVVGKYYRWEDLSKYYRDKLANFKKD